MKLFKDLSFWFCTIGSVSLLLFGVINDFYYIKILGGFLTLLMGITVITDVLFKMDEWDTRSLNEIYKESKDFLNK